MIDSFILTLLGFYLFTCWLNDISSSLIDVVVFVVFSFVVVTIGFYCP